MRLVLPVCAVLLCFVVLAAAQNARQPTAPVNAASSQVSPEMGTIENGRYANQCLGFSLSVPKGWAVNSLGTENGKAIHMPGGELLLLMLDRKKESGYWSRIMLSARTAPAPVRQLKEIVANAVRAQVEATPQKMELVREAYPVEYGGRTFFRSDAKQLLQNGNALYLGFVATVFRSYLVSERLMADAPEHLNEAADSLREIAFGADVPDLKCISVAGTPSSSIGVVGPSPAVLQSGTTGVMGSIQTWKYGVPERIRVSQSVTQALMIHQVQPQYPEEARKAGIEGIVLVNVIVGKSGDVEEAKVLSGDASLADAAITAVKQWKYKPYLLNGQPVQVDTVAKVSFQLSPK